jgi:DMSO/TMAO reductase YedYZ heme-binding membrane subunit
MLEDQIIKPNTSTIVSPAIPAHPPSLWRNTIIFSIILSILIGLYFYAYRGTFTLSTANRVLGEVAIILIGLSFVLSSICYFWNFADHYISYRKQLGVVGFAYAVIHTLVIIFYLDPIFTNFAEYLEQPAFLSYSLALAALIMYTGMIVISTQTMIHKIGGKLWRELLRAGYIAYVFSILHYILLSYDFWLRWFTERRTFLPPFGLITTLFGILVILMRLALMIHKITHEKNNPQPL